MNSSFEPLWFGNESSLGELSLRTNFRMADLRTLSGNPLRVSLFSEISGAMASDFICLPARVAAAGRRS